VSKLSRDGEFVWAKGMGSPGGNDIGNDIAVDSLGNPYITGSFESTADFDPNAGTFNLMSGGLSDIFITRLSAQGDLTWAKRIGSSGADIGYALELDASSNVYTTGSFTGIVDFNPNVGANSLISTNASADAFISKLDSNGNYGLAKWMGGEYSDLGWDLALDGQANIFIAGWYYGPFSFYPDAGMPVLNSLGNRDGFFVKYEHGEVAPSVTAITRAGANPSSTNSVDFSVTFSEAVTSVDVGDFSVESVGVTGAIVSAVGGAANSYTITVNTGSGNGKIGLKIADGATILDSSFIGLDPAGAEMSNFKGNEVYTIIKSAVFADVPLDYWALGFIERLYNEGITGGCSSNPLSYCPENSVTRAQMAVFLEKAIRIKGFSPENVSATFSDTAGHWAEDWIEALKNDGITSGCGAGIYCPENSVTRAQMAVFLLKTRHGSIYTPPPATGTFSDVPADYWAAAWIEQLAAEGITSGCAAGLYCPESPVTRAQMAVFLVKAFNLP
ncbi:MAG: S-layer homology domain-containing protein, partial [Anaerolineales bacterium]|nr:S-layer homology domain-containing protein [Anaerolineales bacterium]